MVSLLACLARRNSCYWVFYYFKVLFSGWGHNLSIVIAEECMAKKIKFNLHCNGQKIANMESLRENFNLEDIVEHFQSGRLQRWLEAQGFVCELEKVRAINATEIEQIIKELLQVFEIETSEDECNQVIQDIHLMQTYFKNKKEIKNILQENIQQQKLSEDWNEEFRNLVIGIMQNSTDKELIRRNLERIIKDHHHLLSLHKEILFGILWRNLPLVFLMSMTIKGFREMWSIGLSQMKNTSQISIPQQIDYKQELFQQSCALLQRGFSDRELDEFAQQGWVKNFTRYSENWVWQNTKITNKNCIVFRCKSAISDAKINDTIQEREVEQINREILVFKGLNVQWKYFISLSYMEL